MASQPEPVARATTEGALDESVDRIIDAALEEIGDRGPSRARMGNIATRAGVSSATLYRRFATKQDLVQAAALREMERFTGAMRAVATEQNTAEDTVAECFAFGVVYMRERTVIRQLIDTEPDLILPLLTTGAGPLIEGTMQLLLTVNAENLFVPRERWQRDVAAVRIEMVVRLFISLLITPGVAIDLKTRKDAREFALTHIAPLIVQADSPSARRTG